MPLAAVIAGDVVLFMAIFSRIIPFQVLPTSVLEVTKRGAYNALRAAIQQLPGGIRATLDTMFTTLKMKQGIERRG